jgi:predicted lipoprotein with Yx(FWY)xxD motif
MNANPIRTHLVRWSTLATLVAGCSMSIAAPLPPTTPEGITLIEVVRELPVSQPEILWLRPGDGEGRTLLTYDADKSGKAACLDACAKEFPPLVAPRGAKANGDWSVVRRKDGVRQWAYQQRPLYIWSKEVTPGEVATNVGLTETANSKLAEDAVQAGSLMPPDGWQVARFEPAKVMKLPDAVDARVIRAVQAVALTDANGFTLYALDEKAQSEHPECVSSSCDVRWQPILAPALATEYGDFSVATRKDGSFQWAYKKRPLYTSSLDQLPGDALAANLDERFSVAQLTESFTPPNVSVRSLEGYGDALTLNGMTLYGGYSFEKRWGGRNLRDTFTNAYYKGKRLGTSACVDTVCLQSWQPLMAPAKAQSQGFWEPLQRADGSKQWAYKGYALYTHAGDKAPGQHYGQATYDFVKPGEEAAFKRVSYLQEISRASGGVGIYWNIAKP